MHKSGGDIKSYMCVPISFTSWWITSSMQQSDLSSATAALEAERFNRWELVWRSALELKNNTG